MPDFRDFLGGGPRAPAIAEVVLPYFGGTRVDAMDRRLRVSGELAPGWYRFRVDGRRATAVEPAAPADLSATKLAKLRGHWVDGWIAIDGKQLVKVALPPDDEPPPLARVTARAWYSGDVVLDGLDFEDDAEVGARQALEERRPLGALAGVVPSLRVAFGLALGKVIAAELDVPATVRELVPIAVAIADRGKDGVTAWVDALVTERTAAAERLREHARRLRLRDAATTARAVDRRANPAERADDALDGAKARLLACRRVARGQQLDVTYDVDGVRVLTLVDAQTLAVIDPGVCLGHNDEFRVLTLDAMPSVVREAVATGRLNITRRA